MPRWGLGRSSRGMLILVASATVLLAAAVGVIWPGRTPAAGGPRPVGARALSPQVANVADGSFTVFWLTAEAVPGVVRYGTDPGSLTSTAVDVRGGSYSGHVHYVEVMAGVSPSTLYYFDVVSGAQVDDDGGLHYRVRTGAVPARPPLPGAGLDGQVRQNGGPPTDDVVVRMAVVDADGQGSTGESAPMSALVRGNGDGAWSFMAANARTADLAAPYSTTIGLPGDWLRMEGQGRVLAGGPVTVTLTEATVLLLRMDPISPSPTATMTGTPVATATPAATMPAPSATTPPRIYLPFVSRDTAAGW